MKFLKYIIIVVLLLTAGCATSKIKTPYHRDDKAYSGFGKTPGREFYTDQDITDSVSLKWQNDANGGFTNSSVVVYDSLVFINDLSGRIYCYNIVTGKQVGQLKNSGAVFSSPFINRYLVIYAVAADKENITYLKYYDYDRGDLVKEIELAGRCQTEIIGTADAVIFNTEDGNVYKYDLKGDKLWKVETNSTLHCSPSMNEDVIIFGNDNGEIIGIRNKDGKILYRKKIGESFFCGTSVSGNLAYTGNDNGNLYAIDLKNGNVKWKFRSGAKIIMTPSVTPVEIYFGNLSGDLFCLDKNNGRLIWKTSTGGVLNATPYAANNLLIVPDLNNKFYFVNRNNGEITNTYPVEGKNKLSPLIYRNLLFIGYDRGELQAYEFK